jgi:hypothetical protein
MFEGTDISLAYGAAYDPNPQPLAAPIVSSNTKPQPPQQQQVAQETATTSHAQPPELAYQPPLAMYTQQPSPAPTMAYPTVPYEEVSFWDKLARKRGDVLKLFMFALVILLALSLDHMAVHYLTNYISKTILTDTQELLVRLSYPIIIVLVIWIMKASA